MNYADRSGNIEAWNELEHRLHELLGPFGNRADALVLSFAGVPQRGAEWNPEWDVRNGPWIQLDVDQHGRIRTSGGSNRFLAEPFRLTPDEIDQMVGLGFSEPELADPDEFSWSHYFLRYDQPKVKVGERANMIVAAFRGPYRAPHPSLLEYRAWGPCRRAAVSLGISSSDDVEREH